MRSGFRRGGHTKGSDAAPAVSASNSGFVTSSLAALAPGWKEQDAPVSLVNNCEPSVVLAFLLVPRSGFAGNVGLGLPSFPNPLGRTTAKKARDGHRPHTSLRVHCLFSPPLHAEAASLIFSADLANAITKIRLSPLRETGFSSQFELFFSPLLSLHFRGRLFGAPTVFSNSLFLRRSACFRRTLPTRFVRAGRFLCVRVCLPFCVSLSGRWSLFSYSSAHGYVEHALETFILFSSAQVTLSSKFRQRIKNFSPPAQTVLGRTLSFASFRETVRIRAKQSLNYGVVFLQ